MEEEDEDGESSKVSGQTVCKPCNRKLPQAQVHKYEANIQSKYISLNEEGNNTKITYGINTKWSHDSDNSSDLNITVTVV